MPHPRIRRYLRHGTTPQLAVFHAIARLGSFTRAAEELHLAQPTVSTQVKKLTEAQRVRFLSEDELKALTEALEACPERVMLPFVYSALFRSIHRKRGQLWSDVDRPAPHARRIGPRRLRRWISPRPV